VDPVSRLHDRSSRYDDRRAASCNAGGTPGDVQLTEPFSGTKERLVAFVQIIDFRTTKFEELQRLDKEWEEASAENTTSWRT
jgi:hypothetical protein